MHTKKRGYLVFPDELRRLNVSRYHAFLNESVGIVSRHCADIVNGSVFLEMNSRLRDIQLDGTPTAAVFSERPK